METLDDCLMYDSTNEAKIWSHDDLVDWRAMSAPRQFVFIPKLAIASCTMKLMNN